MLPGTNQVILFVNLEKETELRDEAMTDGRSNALLPKLHLDSLGPVNRMLRRKGQLSTLYVTRIRAESETYFDMSY